MGKASEFISRLKNIRHKEIIVCAVLLVAVIAVYFSCVSCETGGGDTSVSLDGADYCTAMQIRIEQAVSRISGVGEAKVVINWDRSVGSSFSSAGSENPHATGALIVCDGGASTKVKLDVIYAVSTLLDLSIEKIIVYPKSN